MLQASPIHQCHLIQLILYTSFYDLFLKLNVFNQWQLLITLVSGISKWPKSVLSDYKHMEEIEMLTVRLSSVIVSGHILLEKRFLHDLIQTIITGTVNAFAKYCLIREWRRENDTVTWWPKRQTTKRNRRRSKARPWRIRSFKDHDMKFGGGDDGGGIIISEWKGIYFLQSTKN